MVKVSLSLQAMATRFELVLAGEDRVALRAAGEEALREIERIEAQLSFYRPDSEIARLNQGAARRPVRVSPPTFRLLERCRDYAMATDGAFDVTVGPLMRAWGFVRDQGVLPTVEELAQARALTGVAHLHFDAENFTIAYDRPGVAVDLGGFGKGYAVERAVDLLREYGVRSALLHSGTSSIAVIGAPPAESAWRVALQSPLSGDRIGLVDQALSVSAVHGKSFEAGGREYGHVIDPATGQPVSRALAAAAIGESASVCEVLSTALMVRGPDWIPTAGQRFPGYRLLVAHPDAAGQVITTRS